MSIKLGLILVAVIFSGARAHAYNLISCNLLSSKHGNVSLNVDLMAKSQLVVVNSKGKKKVCDIRLTNIDDKPRSISPSMRIEFEDANCKSRHKIRLFDKMSLTIKSYKKKSYTALFKWLKTSQPQDCKIKSIKMSELKFNEKKWKKGLWGR